MSKQPHKQSLIVRWRLALRDDRRLGPSTKLLGLTLSTYADNGTASTFVGLPTLAKNCRFSQKTARRARHHLRRLGYLDVEHRSGLTSMMTLCLPLPPGTVVKKGNPSQERPKTPPTRDPLTLNNSDRRGVVDDSARLSKAKRWLANNGCHMPPGELEDELASTSA
jgi:hypothetical protein